ncbi:MAG: nucleoside monophosphate kinase [Candidatus Microsaccharimonas sp.]
MIIGIAGPSGAGKDTAAEYIQQKLGYRHLSGGDVLRQIFTQLGLEPTKPALGDLAQLLRKHYGAESVIKSVIKMAGGDNVIVSGFRSSKETEALQAKGGVIVYIDAPAELRHERILERARPGDPQTNEELTALDEREANLASTGENVLAIKETANFVIVNDSSIKVLQQALDGILVS